MLVQVRKYDGLGIIRELWMFLRWFLNLFLYFGDAYFAFPKAGIVDNGRVKLVNKTSNGLECYNCHFNHIFPTAHPNLVTFVQALWKEVDRVLARIENIDKGREDPPEYAEPIFPEIPSKFWEMIESNMEMHDGQVEGVERRRDEAERQQSDFLPWGIHYKFFEVLDQLWLMEMFLVD